MMSSELLIGHTREGVVIRLVGRGTIDESLALRTAAERFLAVSGVILDATHCDYMDSTFLGCLVGIKKLADPIAERRFVIAVPAATRAQIFATSSLDRYFDFVDACPSIIGQWSTVVVNKLERAELGRHVMHCHEHLADRGGAQAAAFKSIADQLAKELGEKPASKSER